MERDEALALLRTQHVFPGPFEFRVVVKPPEANMTVAAMLAGAGESALLENIKERPSRKGTYLALAVRIHLDSAERVLDVYAVLAKMDHVLASL